MVEEWQDETVIILSNGESGNGMSNTPGHFNVRLPKPINLKGMEVAVKNITFPTSWNPVPLKVRHHTPCWCVTIGYDGSGGGHFPLMAKAKTGPLAQWVNGDTAPHNTMLFTLLNAPYKTTNNVVTQMIRQMAEVLPNSEFAMTWELVPINATKSPRRVVLRDKFHTVYTVWANETLCTLLNFGQDPNNPQPIRYLVTEGSKQGQLVDKIQLQQQQHLPTPFKRISNKNSTSINGAIDLNGSAIPTPDSRTQFQRFLVYCDFIKDRIVGGIRTGLLNVTPNPGITVQHHATSFSTDTILPLYYPTNDATLQALTFRVRDDNGDPIEFSWGVTSLELHFRRRRPRL